MLFTRVGNRDAVRGSWRVWTSSGRNNKQGLHTD